jgi:hypothetical protein
MQPVREFRPGLRQESVVLSFRSGGATIARLLWKAPRGLDLCNWRGSISRIKITASGLVKCFTHHSIPAVGCDIASIFRFASSSQMDR